MRAGNLIDRIKFYAKVTARDDFSASADTWPLVTITTRGEIREAGGSRQLSADEKFYSKNKELTIRYRGDIVETMKVQINDSDDRYIITYIEKIGRNEGLRLDLEKDNN